MPISGAPGMKMRIAPVVVASTAGFLKLLPLLMLDDDFASFPGGAQPDSSAMGPPLASSSMTWATRSSMRS